MDENTSEIKNSFFKEYFLYKLRNLRGAVITFAVMNFLSVTGLAAGVLIFVQAVAIPASKDDSLNYGYDFYIIALMLLYLVVAMIFTTVLLISITPALNFKFFNKREYMDTVGGLPLTLKQRFLGDMLSGAASFGLSFVPCSVIAVILAAITESGAKQLEDYELVRYYIPGFEDGYMSLALAVLLTLLLCYTAAYAVSCFVTACCGKVGTSVLFSLITMGALTVTTLSVGGLIINNSIGFDLNSANLKMISVTPPFGTLIAGVAELSGVTAAPVGFPVKTSLVLIILFIIALFGVGSYFAAMRRKTERVERELVFNAGYYVIPALITFTACCFSIWLADYEITYIIPLVLISLAVCLVMAFLDSRSIKKIWKGFAVFAVTGVFCIGLGLLIGKTHGFGISEYIPSQQSVESITISGRALNDTLLISNDYRDMVTVESEDGISLVLSEHKKIVEDIENHSVLRNTRYWDYPLTISYKLKNGLTVTRSYEYSVPTVSKYDDPVYRLAHEVADLPELRFRTVVGLLTDPDMPCVGIIYGGNDPNNITGSMSDEGNHASFAVKPSKYEEFVACYTEDLMNKQNYTGDDIFGIFRYNYIDKSGNVQTYVSALWKSFDKTVEFLRDPDNYEEASEVVVDETRNYRVTYRVYNSYGDTIENMIYFNITHPELAREFLSYMEPEYSVKDGKVSQYFDIYCNDGNGNDSSYVISESNEQAALNALIKAIRAHQAIGGVNQ